MDALETPRLRLVVVTPGLRRAAQAGRTALEAALDAQIPDSWRGDYVFSRTRRVALDDRPLHALIVLRSERMVVGELRFEPLDDGAFEIGYAVAEPWRRRGIAVEAAGALIQWLDGSAAASRIIAGCAMNNRASVRTLRRLGFELDGSSARGGAFWWTWSPVQRHPASGAHRG